MKHNGRDYTDDEYMKLLLSTYRSEVKNNPELTKALIREDIETFALAEKYEVCARLKKILERLE
tara:strand:- start:1150 stop:1341 length:192 start_codon:yes stop_codon:yes gene_type:complete